MRETTDRKEGSNREKKTKCKNAAQRQIVRNPAALIFGHDPASRVPAAGDAMCETHDRVHQKMGPKSSSKVVKQ